MQYFYLSLRAEIVEAAHSMVMINGGCFRVLDLVFKRLELRFKASRSHAVAASENCRLANKPFGGRYFFRYLAVDNRCHAFVYIVFPSIRPDKFNLAIEPSLLRLNSSEPVNRFCFDSRESF